MADLLDLLGDEWAAHTWQPIYRQAGAGDPARCRDCGRPTHGGCGGAGAEGIYELCQDCAALDGRGQRIDGLADVSHWGIRTTEEEHARLTEQQARRRDNYLRKSPTSVLPN